MKVDTRKEIASYISNYLTFNYVLFYIATL
jgi:hypothetical protein